MRVVIIRQSPKRTISVIENDQGQRVAVSNDPNFVPGDTLMTLAYKFREEYPEYFEADRQARRKRLMANPEALEAYRRLFGEP